MPLIVIVHVPDHTTADALIESITYHHDDHGQVVGIFDFPNRAELKCTGSCTRKGSGAWSRDPRGFMKCSICGSRPRRMRRSLLGALFDFLGVNQYPKAPAAFRTPEGYGTDRGQ